MKVIMYGAPICEDCVNAKKALLKEDSIELDYRNIVESTTIMKEFLHYRDVEPMFDDIKKNGKIGIPFFILENGIKTLDIEKHFDKNLDIEVSKNFCSLDGKGNC